MSPVLVVFDLEGDRAPFPLGVYVSTEEDEIRYVDPQDRHHHVPCDCVQIVPVDVYVGPLG